MQVSLKTCIYSHLSRGHQLSKASDIMMCTSCGDNASAREQYNAVHVSDSALFHFLD